MPESIDVKDFGAIVKRERKSREWSQDHLASLSSVPKNTIQNIETGKTKNPHGDKKRKLATAFGYESVEDMREGRKRDAIIDPDVLLAVAAEFEAPIEIVNRLARWFLQADAVMKCMILEQMEKMDLRAPPKPDRRARA